MNATVGDRVILESEDANVPPRDGVIEEVLDADEPRYRVRWDSGRTSIIVPEAGVLRIEENDSEQS